MWSEATDMRRVELNLFEAVSAYFISIRATFALKTKQKIFRLFCSKQVRKHYRHLLSLSERNLLFLILTLWVRYTISAKCTMYNKCAREMPTISFIAIHLLFSNYYTLIYRHMGQTDFSRFQSNFRTFVKTSF